jgi:pyruvate, water dikinase
MDRELSTGLPGLDRMLRGLMPGDNVVWQVRSIEDYVPFVRPYCAAALASGRKFIYFRFARHEALIPESSGAEVCELDPEAGFEGFLEKIHSAIERAGRGAFYVFDCLSDLSADWYSDQMLGNFFMLTCPYLYDLETATYFALLRNCHSVHATVPIAETTQLLLDVYRHKERLYIHPLKVQHRFSPTMHMLHVWKDDGEFAPVTESCTNAEIVTAAPGFTLDAARHRLGIWTRTVLQAEEVLEDERKAQARSRKAEELFRRLLRMAVSRDRRVLELAERYFDLGDVVAICKRMIGTGLIGGKSVGMLLARAILERSDAGWKDRLEVHDSFYIASDVFYTFLVRNGCWWIRQRLRDPEHYLGDAETVRRRILTGSFPEHIEQQFTSMLDYFGQSPIIVRSSSLLEDNFGNAFAGKYDSVFCVNQGSRHRRLDDFISAVKTIYASTMSERALTYRARRGMLDRDEQMALLVQRVSGGVHGSFYYPQIAGVGYSFNPYVWTEEIDPGAGLLRLVFGLGTRAVDRSDDDYTRVVALNLPGRRPEGEDRARQYMQRKVDALDLEGNLLVTRDFHVVAAESEKVPLELFATRDRQAEREARRQRLGDISVWVLSFDRLLKQTTFVEHMRQMLGRLHEAYNYPVDVEFTANFETSDAYKINIVQCRPFQVKGSTTLVEPPAEIAPDDLLLRTCGPIIGQSRIDTIERVVYVVPSIYGQMAVRDRYTVARLIGRLIHAGDSSRPETIMLLGPGRWGTTTPTLGVPVSFAEISRVSVLCEIVAMREDLVPDVSLGTHFFSELVEAGTLYLALFPDREGNALNQAFFERSPNQLSGILPSASAYAHVIRVIDGRFLANQQVLRLYADTLKQRALFYVDRSIHETPGVPSGTPESERPHADA